MEPFDSSPPGRSAQSPPAAAPYVAAVRPFHAISADDQQPVARVRLTNGLTYLSWHHVRHDDLAAVTHRPATYWLHIDRHAHDVVARIRTLSATGALPPIACFTELRHHIDPGRVDPGDRRALTRGVDGCATPRHRHSAQQLTTTKNS